MDFSKILIVGYGSAGQRHFRLLSKLFPKADIRILKTQKSNLKISLSKFFFKTSDAISFGPQLAIIASPASLHIHHAIQFAKTGCHLFIEKPISNNSKKIKDLINIRNKKKLFIQVGYNMRFLQSLKFFKKQIDKKKVGKIYSVRCETGKYLPFWRPKQDYSKSVSANKSLGGGVLLELSHELDYLIWIFGRIISTSSHIKRHSNLKIDTEDCVYLNLEALNVKQRENLHINLNLDFIRYDNTRTCIVIGEKGTLKWDGIKNTVSIINTKNKKWKKIYSKKMSPNESYLNQWKSFILNYKSNQKPAIEIEDALMTLKIIQNAIKSNKIMGKAIKEKII